MTDQQNESELLPCPFCGGEGQDRKNYENNTWIYSVRCKECDVTTDFYGSKKKAIAAWNRRVETKNSESDELYVSYKLGLEKGLEINRQNTADWTSEVPTEEGFYWVLRKYDTMMIVYVCNIGGRMEVHGSSNPHQLLMEAYIDSYDIVAWSKIPTPPLPGKEGM